MHFILLCIFTIYLGDIYFKVGIIQRRLIWKDDRINILLAQYEELKLLYIFNFYHCLLARFSKFIHYML